MDAFEVWAMETKELIYTETIGVKNYRRLFN